MKSPETDESDAYDKVFSLYEIIELPLTEAVSRIKEAECFVPEDDGFYWVLIARAWFDLCQSYSIGFQDVIRCLLIAEPMTNYFDGLLAGVDVWLDMAEYDRRRLPSARKWMSMAENDIYPIGKVVVGATWLLATACFFPPLETHAFAGFGRTLFGALAAVHVVECIAFLGVLKQSPRPLPGELWQTFLFGIIHVSIVRKEIAQAAESS